MKWLPGGQEGRTELSRELLRHRVAEPSGMRSLNALQPSVLGGTLRASSPHGSQLQREEVDARPDGVPQGLGEVRQHRDEGVRTRSGVCSGPKGADEFWQQWARAGRQPGADLATAVAKSAAAELWRKRRDAESGPKLAEEQGQDGQTQAVGSVRAESGCAYTARATEAERKRTFAGER